MAAHWTASNLTEEALRGAVDALVAQGALAGKSNAHRQEAIAAFLAGDTGHHRGDKGGGCNRYWARPNGPLITRVLAHLNAERARAPLAEADPDLNQNTQHHTTTTMLAMQSQQTQNLLATLGGLVTQHLLPGLTATEWDHLVEASLHTAALNALDDEDSGSSSADPVPPSQSAAHRAAKAPKARTTTYFRRQRVGGDKPPRPKGKAIAAPRMTLAEGLSKTIRKKRKADKKKRPLSGYNLFFGHISAQVRAEHPDKDFNERGRIAGAMWTALPAEEKQEWKAKAVVVNARAKAAAEAQAAAMAPVVELEEEDEDYEEEEAEESESEDEESEDEEESEEEGSGVDSELEQQLEKMSAYMRTTPIKKGPQKGKLLLDETQAAYLNYARKEAPLGWPVANGPNNSKRHNDCSSAKVYFDEAQNYFDEE